MKILAILIALVLPPNYALDAEEKCQIMGRMAGEVQFERERHNLKSLEDFKAYSYEVLRYEPLVREGFNNIAYGVYKRFPMYIVPWIVEQKAAEECTMKSFIH